MVKEITDYLQQRLADNFRGWTREALEDYVMFHMEHEQLLAVQTSDGIQAVLIGWPTEEMQLERFQWQKATEHGRFWFWDQIVASTPEAAMIGFSEFFCRRPESVQLPSYGVRHGKIRQFKPVLTLYKKGQEIHGN
jgi:hypothetical protein